MAGVFVIYDEIRVTLSWGKPLQGHCTTTLKRHKTTNKNNDGIDVSSKVI